MISHAKRTSGFTLIELLVVIAIIGILAGFIAVGLPRVLTSAKLAKLDNVFLQVRNVLTEYYVDHGSYPPGYGYLDRNAVEYLRNSLDIDITGYSLDQINDLQTDTNVQGTGRRVRPVHTRPWMDFLGLHNNDDMLDLFSIAYDTDADAEISRLEFTPAGRLSDPANQSYAFDGNYYEVYGGHNDAGVLLSDRNEQLDSQGPRPLLYFPINTRQFRKVAAGWYDQAAADSERTQSDPRPDDSDLGANPALLDTSFPPPNYDAYVLISVGPNIHTGGLIYELTNNSDCDMCLGEYGSPAYYYHILGMAAYFMASRDGESGGQGDGELDFDYRARTTRGQVDSDSNYLPDRGRQRAPGPVIFVGEG